MLTYLQPKWRLWTVGLTVLCWLLPVSVMAQDGETAVATTAVIQRLNVQVMPEFDDSRVLVIVQGRLAADSANLPQTITVRVPQDAQINQMAVVNMETGAPTAQPYDTAPDPADGRWLLATYTVDSAHFFYEYYFNPLSAGAEKRFTFTLSTLHPITELVLEVQQPRTAEDFVTEPTSDSSQVDSYGLTMYQFTAGTLPAGGETTVSIQYTKTDTTPSVPRQQAPETTAATNNTLLPTWVFGLLAAVAVSTFAGFAWYRTRLPKPAPIIRTHYCPQCGTPQRDDAHYCHACGAAL